MLIRFPEAPQIVRVLPLFLIQKLIFMKLNYSNRLYKGLHKTLFFFLFVLPFYTFSQNCTLNANADKTICPGGDLALPPDQFYLLGTANTAPGTSFLQNPVWTQISGPSVQIANPNLVQTLVTGAVPGNTYTFRLSAQCGDGSTVFDDVVFVVSPLTISNAGQDQTYCQGTYNLNANAVGASETGAWTVVGNNNAGVTINSPNSPNSTITVSGNSSGSTTLRWTITNSSSNCTSTDDVVISSLGGRMPVTAGPDVTLSNCYSSVQTITLDGSFGGNSPGQQQGTWTVVSGPNIPSFANVNRNNTTVTGLTEGTYVFRWTVAGTCANGVDEVTIVVPPPTADVTNVTGAQLFFCDGRTSTLLQGTIPLYVNESVQWTQTGGPTAVIQNPASSSTVVSGMNTLGTYTFLYTLTNSATNCVTTANYVVTLEEIIAISGGADQTLGCNESSVTIPVTYTGNGKMSWQIVDGPIVNPLLNPPYPSYPTPLVTFSGNSVVVNQLTFSGTYIVRLIKEPNQGSQCETIHDDISIVVSAQPTTSSAGTMQIVPCNSTSATLAGNIATHGKGKWSQVSGPSVVTFSDPFSRTATVSPLVNGKYVFRWTISGGPACAVSQSTSEVLVSSAVPTPADAGTNQAVCFGVPIQLHGNATLNSENGTWTVSPGAGVLITNPNDPNTTVSGLVANTTYTFTWTIANGCGTSADTVDVVTNNTQGANANAGADQCLATGTNTITLDGNDPSPGNGLWTQTAGAPVTITNPALYNTTVTGVTDGDYTFKWTVSNVGCLDGEDTVAITIAPAITMAQAGADQSLCDTTTATVTANTPAAGETGLWELVSGGDGPVIGNPSSASTTITGLTTGFWVYRWTISRGACVSSSDTVQLNIDQAPSPAIAGQDQVVCNQSSVTLGATPVAVGNGIWSLISGPNSPVFSNLKSPTSTLSGLITGEYILEWTTYNGINCPTSKDQMTVKVTEVAAAGPDFATCLEGPLYLVGNNGSTGTWSYVSGGAGAPTISLTSNNSAAVTNLVPGVYIFRYTIAAQGSCPETSDDIQVTVNGQIVTPPNAGPNQSFCNAGPTEIQLAASALDPGTTGKWTILFGPTGGSFVDDTNPNTIFSNPGYGFYVLNWKVSSGSCSESDQVRIENAEPPSPALAGNDQVICGSVTDLTAIPPLVGVGSWVQVSGPTTAVLSSVISPTTTVSNLTQTGGVYVFSWTVRNGTICTPATDTVQITVTADLTVPTAGPDQTICESGTAILAGNAITVGTGQWSQINGPATGSFSNNASPTSSFTPNGAGSYVLRWSSTNLSCTFSDDMTLTVDPQPSASNAGTPITICEFQTLTLAANTPTVGTGLWTQVSGPSNVGFVTPTSPTTNVLGTQAGTYVFSWTITSGSCPPTSSNVTVTINPLPPLAEAGADQTLCNTTTATLNGNNPGLATGVWTFVSNPGNTALITNINAFNTTVTNISVGTTRLKWTISSGTCNSYSDEVNITRASDLTVAPLTGDSVICQGGTITLNATPTGSIAPYTYQWQTSPDGVTGWTDIGGQTNAVYTTNNSLTNGEYYYRVNVFSTCAQITSNVAKLTIISDPLVTTQPVGNTICSGGTHTMSVAATTTNAGAGTITYQWQRSANGTSGWTNVSDGTGATASTYTTGALTSGLYFRVRIRQSASGCETFSDPAQVNVVTITAQPASPAAICTGGIVNINISASLNGGTGTLSYQWQSNSGSGFVNETNPTATTANFTSDVLNNTIQFRCVVTSSATNCTLTSTAVTATVVADPSITVQPTGGIICSGGTFVLSVEGTGGTPALTYQWYDSSDNVNFNIISGANSSTYTTPALTADTYYRVAVSANGNGCGLVTSNNVLVDVIPDPVVNLQPVGNTICSSGTHTMIVAASGDLSGGPLIYQWERSANGSTGWTNVSGGSGANTASYTTGPLSSRLYYRVRITQAARGCEVYSDVVPVFVAAIATQPVAPAAICIGGTVNITIAASLNGGVGTLSYQWQSNSGSGFVNETNASATTANFTSDVLNTTTDFRCIVTSSNTNCTLTSNTVTATVVPDPAITVQPAGTTICSGGNHTLSVTATNGTPFLTYQWYSSLNNSTFTAISGATSATYVTPALTQTTYYRVDVSASGNGCNTIASSVATVTVLSAITIVTQPVLKTNICSGSGTTLNVVVAGGAGNYTYQWKSATNLAGPFSDISGATSASYTTPNLTQTTFYQVAISDSTQGCTTVLSSVASVIIPSITTQPVTPPTVCTGGTVSISTLASANNGSASFTYQWQTSADGINGWADITGEVRATNPNYISGPLTTSKYYRCIITSSNPNCMLVSNVVLATVIPDPVITVQPVGGNICEGGTFTMTSGVTNGSGNFTYQWQKSLDGTTGWANVTDGSGANTTTYTTGVVNADIFYRLRVTDSGIGCGVVNSNAAKVDVFDTPLISTQPKDGKECINQSYTFTVVASGNIPSGTLLYQWQTATVLSGPYTNVTNGTGGTTASYTTPVYATAGDRYFRVVVSQTESGCQTISNQVTLSIFDLPAAPSGVVIQQPSCDYSTGIVNITNPDLGTGYEYSSDGVTFQASNVFAGLPSGNVTIYVRRTGLNTCISSGTTFVILNRICAVPENFATISGDTGGNTGAQTILDSDTLNGVAVTPSTVNVTINSISSYLTFNPLTNTISVAAGTPSGDYMLTYTICEIVNPGNLSDPANFVNCSTTTEAINVTTAGIDARIDIVKFVVNGYVGANNVINVLTNDSLASLPATTSNVTISVVNPALPINPAITTVPYLDIATGNVNVPPGTVRGLYEIEYRICETAVPANCDTAMIYVQVGAPLIDANDDKVEDINGYTGQINALNALTNDTLNGQPITGTNFNEITITQNSVATPLYPGANVPVFSAATGNISIPAGTPADTYYITYTICEKLNPLNCSNASIAIVVDPAPLIVNDDVVNNVNSYEGAVDVINVYTNPAGADTFNGQVLNINLANVLTPAILVPATPKSPGAPVPELAISSGFVTVPPGTPAGQYQIKYQICEDLNPGNCDDAIVTINVVVPIIEANDDNVLNVNGYEGANDVINAYDNDLLNGGALDLSEITVTVISTPAAINGGPVPTLDSVTGFVSVPPGTPAGEYKFTYKICENLNPVNCDDAVITITVVPAPLDAVNDANFAPINGSTGSTNALNALDNDTLNGSPVIPSEVTITNIIPATPINGGLVPVLDASTGNVSVPPGTAAGIYFIGYQLNEKLNLLNNDSAVITIEVSAPIIEANDDTVANINGYITTVNAINVLLNDKINGATATISQVNITVDVAAVPINGKPVPVLQPLTGSVVVPAGTPAGDYEIQYQICEKINPLNCDTATVFINVVAPPIDAVNDAVANISGFTGANNVLNALANDTLNGAPIIASQVTISNIVPAISINGGAIPVLNPLTGNVDVPAGTAAGTYTIEYRLTENLNPSNFDTATITITVVAPIIIANDDNVGNINGYTGANNVINAITNDRLNGADIPLIKIDITSLNNVNPVSYVAGNPVPVLNTLTGNVDVPPGTSAGTYIIRYRICETLNPLNCSEANITVNVIAPIIDANNDFANNINGYTGGNAVVNALTNDKLNGLAVQSNEVNIHSLNTISPPTSTNGIVPVLNTLTGSVDVPPGTSAGTYSIEYEICEALNPTNCSQATIIIIVNQPSIEANDDSTTNINGSTGTNNALNAFTGNDRYNGAPLTDLSLIIPTILSPAIAINGGSVPVLDLTTGFVSIPPGTAAGTYQIKYRICDKLNPSNCDDAIITIQVIVPVIVANDDSASNIIGYTGATNVLNAYDNDTLNGTAVVQSGINKSLVTSASSINGGSVPIFNVATGSVDVPAGTPAGEYRIVYKICDRLNPSNCDEAVITITVIPNPINAVDDNATGINGFTGNPNAINVLDNDTLNGVKVIPSEVVISNVIPATSINSGLVPVLDPATGNVSVPAGTPAGTYIINYTLRESTSLTNTDMAIVTIVVVTPVIEANNDILTNINGLDGAADIINVLANDVLNTSVPTLSQVKLTVISPAVPINSIAVPVLNTTTGLVSVPSGTAAGTYTIVYQICDNLNPANCDTAEIKVSVVQPAITLIKRGVFVDTNKDGYAQPGELIRYSFRITNTGTIDLNNVTVTDPKATISGTPIATLAVGKFDVTSYTATYVLTQADINSGSVTNQALVTAQPTVGKPIQNLSDSDDPVLTGDNDPTVTPVPQHRELTLIKGGQLTGNGGIGSVINYTFTVKNTGNVVLTNVEITDPMLTTSAIAVTPGTLTPGATGRATASYTVTATDVINGMVVNTALGIGNDPQGNTVTDISDSDDPTLPGDDDPTVIDLTLKPSIALIKTAVFNDENRNGYAEIGETVTYRFSVTNTGNIILVNAVIKDPKPGIVITGGPIALKQGETNSDNFVGTYVLTAVDIESGSVENQAEVSAITLGNLKVTDLSDANSILTDNPTILPLNSCKVVVHNAFSPNGDGINDVFKIDGIECYADAYVEIYDRWGVLVYDAHDYDNNAVAFRGISEGRATVTKQKGLPVGTYFYVITFKTYLNEPVSLTGYLYMSR